MKPLDAIEQRVANGAERILTERLQSLVKSSVATDPAVRQSIQLILQAETASLTATLKREWNTRLKEFLLAQERQANARMAEQGRLMTLRLKGTFRALALALLCLTVAWFLVLLVPDATRRIWEPPYMKTLETQNQQLTSQVSFLRLQPVLKDRILLYPGPQGMWAEVEQGAKPVLTEMFYRNPADTRQAWLIPLRQQKP